MKQDIFETPAKDIKFKDLPAWQAWILIVSIIAIIIGSAGTGLVILAVAYAVYWFGKNKN